MITYGKKTERSYRYRFLLLSLIIFSVSLTAVSQPGNIRWSDDGDSYYGLENNEIVLHNIPGNTSEVFLSSGQLTPQGEKEPLKISWFSFSGDHSRVLLFTNEQQVWRIKTKGDYWVKDMKTGSLRQVGKELPASSLMFAKLSPDGRMVAYVSGNNIYAEDLETSAVKALTTNGSVTMINGTFDWVYEEEFFCRDGFRWSPDSKSIAYWQIDAGKIRKFYMINNTDSVYSRIVPVEYPKTGQDPSSCRVGVVNVANATTTWLNIPGDPAQNYIVRMEFIPSTNNLLIQQLNRRQNRTRLFMAGVAGGDPMVIYEEADKAWIDVFTGDANTYAIDFVNDFAWIDGNKNILWASEKDGWRHLYLVSLEGKPETLVTRGDFDVISFKQYDPEKGYVYFMASPENATQKYLYRTRPDGKGRPELMSPATMKGTHEYAFPVKGRYAFHTFSNYCTRRAEELIVINDHKPLDESKSISAMLDNFRIKSTTEFFKIKTQDGVEMDGWMVKPESFDPSKKYPVVFYVYTEPGSATVTDVFGADFNFLYAGSMAKDGYIYISIDNRGTPVPKGREWRKSIYRKSGQINIHDQAMAAKEILKWKFVDPERIAVWGWSGGGSATLNLMFQYPEIYKAGISIASVGNLLTYDNIYMERYMGLPQENMEDYIKGSPVTYARNLKGSILIIHGTGDDNVHYQNAELLLNELIKYNKQFQFMPYPNRTHSLAEGEGTFIHLRTLYTSFLQKHCPPGGR